MSPQTNAPLAPALIEQVSQFVLKNVAAQVPGGRVPIDLPGYIDKIVAWALTDDADHAEGAVLVAGSVHIPEALRWAAIEQMKNFGVWRVKDTLPTLINSPAFPNCQYQVWDALYHHHGEYSADFIPWLKPFETELVDAGFPNGRKPRPQASKRPLRVGVWSHKIGNYISSMNYVHPWLLNLPDKDTEVFILSERRAADNDPMHALYRQVFGKRLLECQGLADKEFLKLAYGLDLDLMVILQLVRPTVFHCRLSRCHLDFNADLNVRNHCDMTLISQSMAVPELTEGTGRRFVVIPDPIFVSAHRPDVTLKERNPADVFRFGAFCRALKFNEKTFDLWAAVLRACPAAELFCTGYGTLQKLKFLLDGAFAKRGVDPARVTVGSGVLPNAEHLDRYNSIDLVLDAYPLGSSVTSHDAFWMGVPQVYLGGDKRTSPLNTTMLLSLMGPEAGACVSTPEEYVAYAKAHYEEGLRPKALREKLRARNFQVPLYDNARYTGLMRKVLHAAARLPSEKLTHISLD